MREGNDPHPSLPNRRPHLEDGQGLWYDTPI
jgi:hypothetical protein